MFNKVKKCTQSGDNIVSQWFDTDCYDVILKTFQLVLKPSTVEIESVLHALMKAQALAKMTLK